MRKYKEGKVLLREGMHDGPWTYTYTKEDGAYGSGPRTLTILNGPSFTTDTQAAFHMRHNVNSLNAFEEREYRDQQQRERDRQAEERRENERHANVPQEVWSRITMLEAHVDEMKTRLRGLESAVGALENRREHW